MTSSGRCTYSRIARWKSMERSNEMLAFNGRLKAATEIPARLTAESSESRLNVVVVFTSVDATVEALQKAGNLAESLGAQITLVVPQIIPFPLPLTSPPVLLDFQEKRFREIASKSPVDVLVQLYLCRDARVTLNKVLHPHSLIVVGSRKKWWPTSEARLARELKRAGHEVILAEMR
jgi:hypothetical protein